MELPERELECVFQMGGNRLAIREGNPVGLLPIDARRTSPDRSFPQTIPVGNNDLSPANNLQPSHPPAPNVRQ